MAIAVAKKALSEDVLNDNHSFDLPKNAFEERFAPLKKDLLKYGISDPSSVKFDPERHILFTEEYYEKTKKHTFEELGMNNLHQPPVSPIAITEPFPLFTEECVAILRYELFQKEVIEECGRVNNSSTTGDLDFFVKGFTQKYAPFTEAAWSHPKTMEVLNKMTGTALVHYLPFEIAATNISIKAKTTKLLDEDLKDEDDPEKIAGILAWHFDSPQVSIVLMLSDTSKMIGGETAMMKGDGKLAKVSNPKQGWASMIQGRVIRHIAPKPKGEYTERITQVASYRPADPMLDKCVMTTVKPSKLSSTRYNEFYKDWMNYRLEVLTKRIDILKNQVNTAFNKGELFDQLATIEFIQKNIVEYAEHSWQEFEVVDDGLVEKPPSYHVVQARWE